MSPHSGSGTVLTPILAAPPRVIRVLGSRLDVLTSFEAIERIRDLAVRGQPSHVITGNTLMLLAARTDAALSAILENAALVVPESWGVRWASRRSATPLSEFLPGIDLMVRLCARAQEDEHSIFFLGAAPGIADAAARQLQARFPRLRIAGTHHGYFSPL